MRSHVISGRTVNLGGGATSVPPFKELALVRGLSLEVAGSPWEPEN